MRPYRFRCGMARLTITADKTRRAGDMADKTFRNVINGELVDAASGETYDVIDPTTGEVYATAPMSGAEDVDRAYAAAATAFECWADSTPQDRATAMLQ